MRHILSGKVGRNGAALKKVVITALLALFLSASALAQPVLVGALLPDTTFGQRLSRGFGTAPGVSWEKVFGGSGVDWLRDVKRAPGGGYVAVGALNYSDKPGVVTKGLVVRLSPSGEVQWTKNVGKNGRTIFEALLVERDGFVAAGYTNEKGSGAYDGYIVKVSLAGKTLWERTFGYSGSEFLYCVARAADGYVAAGRAQSRMVPADVEAYLLKTDFSGKKKWERYFGSDAGRDGEQEFTSVIPLSDGSFFLAGSTAEASIGIDVYVVKASSRGEMVREKSFGTTRTDIANCAVLNSGGFFIAGWSGVHSSIWKLDGTGKVVWRKEYRKGIFNHIEKTSDGKMVAAGFSSLPDGRANAYCSLIDANGGKKSEIVFGGGDISSIYSVVQDSGSVTAAGVTNSRELGAQGQDCYLAKLSGLVTAPSVYSISPASGSPGSRVELKGKGFSEKAGSDGVFFGSVRAGKYYAWTADRIVLEVPDLSPGRVRVTVRVSGFISNGVDFLVTGGERPASFYFAEGYVTPDFHAYLCLGNAGGDQSLVRVQFMLRDSRVFWREFEVRRRSRLTIFLNHILETGTEFSMYVEPDSALVFAERVMYFNYGGSWDGGHCVPGARSPSKRWYFAEGTTRRNFDEWITIQNPGERLANLCFRYMIEGEGPREVKGSVPPFSRGTFSVRDHIGDEKDASLLVKSDVEVVAERPVYFSYGDGVSKVWTGGHCTAGVNWPDKRWYFAEGTTRRGFEEWLCLQNPNDFAITVRADYLLSSGQGGNEVRYYNVNPNERLTVFVNKEIGAGKDISLVLTSDEMFVAERPVYFDYPARGTVGWDGGHNVMGILSLSSEVLFAEGYTGEGFDEWICVMNPWEEGVSLHITYLEESGAQINQERLIPPSSRLTLCADEAVGTGKSISALVEASAPVACERPMYFLYGGRWSGGHTVPGYPCDLGEG